MPQKDNKASQESLYHIEIPYLVRRAKDLATELGFDLRPEGNRAGTNPTGPSCCINEVGVLLKTLSSSVRTGKIGEIGTGAGVGRAWIVSGMAAGVTFATAEVDSMLANSVAKLLAEYETVRVYDGDWRREFMSNGPYNLIFADGGGVGNSKEEEWPLIADLLVPGGIMVIDDLTPEELWPSDWIGKPDSKRELAFNSGFFQSTEVRSRPDVSTLIMVRK